MNIEPITGVLASEPLKIQTVTTGAATAPDFSTWVEQQLKVTNQEIIQADSGVRRLALGEGENLHQVMLGLEKAKLSFELITQVRNKFLEAYQDLLRMQI